MVWEIPKVAHHRSAELAFLNMAGGEAVAFGFAAVEGVGERGAPQQGRGEGVVGLKCVGASCQGFL